MDVFLLFFSPSKAEKNIPRKIHLETCSEEFPSDFCSSLFLINSFSFRRVKLGKKSQGLPKALKPEPMKTHGPRHVIWVARCSYAPLRFAAKADVYEFSLFWAVVDENLPPKSVFVHGSVSGPHFQAKFVFKFFRNLGSVNTPKGG